MGFTFKAFHIKDEGLGMPVSTDAVLLGAWAPLDGARTILDLGAGSGLLALMAAQRSQARVSAIEIDAEAARICAENFAASPWDNRLRLILGDVTDTNALKGEVFTHIVCNPPYFETGPVSQKPGRAHARHTGSLSFDSLCAVMARLLDSDGTASLVLPVESEAAFMRALTDTTLGVSQRVEVCTVEGKPPRRVLLAVRHANRGSADNDSLAVRDINGQYTPRMKALTQDFYLKL